MQQCWQVPPDACVEVGRSFADTFLQFCPAEAQRQVDQAINPLDLIASLAVLVQSARANEERIVAQFRAGQLQVSRAPEQRLVEKGQAEDQGGELIDLSDVFSEAVPDGEESASGDGESASGDEEPALT